MNPIDYTSRTTGLMQDLGNQMRNYGLMQEKREMIEQQQAAAEQAANQRKAEMAMASDLFKSGTPAQIAEFMFKHEDAGKRLNDMMGFRNDATKQNMIQGMQAIIANPNSAEQIITDRIEFVKSQGGNPTQTMQELVTLKEVGPEKYAQMVEAGYSMLDPQGYQAFTKTKGDPNADLIRHKMILDNQLKQEQIADYQKQTSLRGQPTAKQLADEAKAKEKAQQEQTETQNKIYTVNQNISAIDTLLNNQDYLDKVTGVSSRLPTVSTTATEADAYLDNIKNSMTIENLGVMSGPLTDKDIQIIASASSRLNKGMSEAAFKRELNTIKAAYERVKKNYAKQAKQGGYEVDLTEGVVTTMPGGFQINQDDALLLNKYLNK